MGGCVQTVYCEIGSGKRFSKTYRFTPAHTDRLTDRQVPEELAEGLVVGEGAVVLLGEGVLDILQTPLLHQLTRQLGLLGRHTHTQGGTSGKHVGSQTQADTHTQAPPHRRSYTHTHTYKHICSQTHADIHTLSQDRKSVV